MNGEGPVQEPDSLIIIWLRVKTESINNFYSFLLTRLMPQSQHNPPGLHTNNDLSLWMNRRCIQALVSSVFSTKILCSIPGEKSSKCDGSDKGVSGSHLPSLHLINSQLPSPHLWALIRGSKQQLHQSKRAGRQVEEQICSVWGPLKKV